MIGLGSNRLTVCRRGGMSVTQAGRGGMEWLAGGRMPLWVSPYSAQATAALYAQFPTQWPTIRDYGFAHPEIVGYMNAYAPEDAKIAYSLVEGIGTRWLVKTDIGTYIDTGVIGTNNTHLKVKAMLLETPPVCTAVFGADISYVSRNFTSWLHWSNGNDSIGYGGQQISSSIPRTPLNVAFVLDANKNHWTNTLADGTVQWDKTFREVSAYTTPSTMALFTYRRNGTPSTDTRSHKIAYCEIEDGSTHKYFVPYNSRTKGLGMLDLLSGDFYEKQGSGSFSESIESPS